jgi:hypothetical protein
MAKKITVAGEKPSGLNSHFNVPGQGVVTRGQLVRQVERGLHPGYHLRELNGVRIIASNPDRSKSNNLG